MTTNKFDLQAWLTGTGRDIEREGSKVRSVTVRRRFDAPIDRVWSAWTEGWITKVVEGEPKLGHNVVLDLGQPQRTTCKILVCDPPSRLAATWTYGAPTEHRPDEVEVRLSRDGTGTVLELEHTSESGAPWAPGVGAGWEAGIIIFDYMLRGEDPSGAFESFPVLDEYWTKLVNEPGS
jgi:uncharacterized protein YndB with AHSA1/START domain